MSTIPALLVCALTATQMVPEPPAATPPPVDDIGAVVDGSRQLVVVQTAGWEATTGRLQRYERVEGAWQAVGTTVDVVVGAGGLGWGIGLHGGGVGVSAPRKVEGDERGPAGIFRLTRAYGRAAAPRSGLPSHAVSAGDVCVDDVGHPAYNRILSAAEVAAGAAPWKSAEQLHRKDWLYDLFVVIDQNHAEGDRVVAGRGSCVFLHVWRAEKRPTAGCTAMERAPLEDLIRWLQADDRPLLVQLPRPLYAQVRGTWHLP